jgi:ribosome biogenesis protein SSF1/2
MKLSEARRVVLFAYDPAQNRIEFRHFLITVRPVGISRPVKKLIRKTVPSLGRLQDVSELFSPRMASG